MRNSFLLLAVSNLLVMAVTFVLGMSVTPQGEDTFTRHFLMGLLTGLFTCFVHVVAFMYFVVCEKIVRQSVLSGQIGVEHAERAQRLKSRAIRLSMAGIGLMVLTTLLGGAAIARFDVRYHFVSAIVTIGATLVVFVRQYSLIDEGGRNFEDAFAMTSSTDPAKQAVINTPHENPR